ncbi:hypothetical protein FYK55_13595 [Roseiconus nitratireducens]|uniref:Uncharacterized protein n=1 Tax=Roseiconus nitratireducens TaxID=2605748 RepID=A0A5M6D9F5_9BACT|nr:hypothetical protein [Roseiconus nitratireducens]KAA5542569.1 hypothetical protein FYK55_13595 [Roseiconus nitratireducens]
MSRLVGFGFALLDFSATAVSLLNCSMTLAVVTFSLVSSLALATMSGAVRSLLWPTYFWDQPEGDR